MKLAFDLDDRQDLRRQPVACRLALPVVVILAFAAMPASGDSPRLTSEDHGGLIVNLPADSFFNSHVVGFDVETASKEETEAGYRRRIDQYRNTRISHLFINLNYQRACYDSDAWAVYGDDCEDLKELTKTSGEWTYRNALVLRRGVDPFQIIFERARKWGISPWISMRMNDTHYVGDPHKANPLWRDHPEYRSGGLDYSYREVREHHLALIREMFDRYDVDGLEMDWMRFLQHFKRDEAKGKCDVMTGFVRRVRELANATARRRGHPVGLAVRVPATPEFSVAFGLDVATWVREGLIDILVTSNLFIPVDTDLDIEGWRKAIGPVDHQYTLAAGSDRAYKNGVILDDIELARGFTANMLGRGADRIYLFNHHWLGQDVERSEYLAIFEQAGCMAAAVSHTRRHVLTFHDVSPPGVPNPRQIPARLSPDASARFRINIGPKPASGNAALRIALDQKPTAKISAHVNRAECGPMENVPKAPGPGSRTCTTRVSSEAVQFDIPLRALQRGENEVGLAMENGSPLSVVWMEIYLAP